jgi:predicted dehydrogenase
MAVIGTGTRGRIVNTLFRKHADCEFVAACDVRESRLGDVVKLIGGKVDSYGDYRRILERKDIDAVLVTTPDHWHSPITVDACAAGKDVYVEKPLSNTIPAAQRMVEAARKYNRVVQLGTQQRSGQHFQEAAKLIQDGLLGNISHAVLVQPGGYTQVTQPAEKPPADLDWEMFQGPAPRKPYSPSRLRWRSYYDYGGGLVTDWGVHLTDIVMMYLKADSKGPLLTSASAQFINFPRDEEQVPDAFTCSWQYDNFVMTFTNVVTPISEYSAQGNWFYGQRGVLHINRSGYRVIPSPSRGGRGGPQAPPIQAKTVPIKEDYENDPDTTAHARNFLDCIKSRKRSTSDVEIGFNSTLPTLIALLAIQQGRAFRWDGKTARPA